MKKFFLFLIALIFGMTAAAYADFYTWEDNNGTTHITDYPPPQGKKAKVYQDEGSGAAATKEAAQASKAKDVTVLLFTKNECPDCVKARDFLNSKNYKFTEYNMDSDKDAEAKRKEFDENKDVPFAVINRTHIYGFSEAVYERALKSVP